MNKMNKMEYPRIDSELCSGCGICIEICPVNTIIIEKGTAKIIEENCSNCRICESVCPIEAIQ